MELVIFYKYDTLRKKKPSVVFGGDLNVDV